MIRIQPDNTTLSDLGTSSSQKVAWVPSEAIAFHLLTPPKGSRKLWRKSVPYMLEESLVVPLETQHFVFGALTRDGQLPVAVVDREKMDYWLGLLRMKSNPVRFLCPDLLAVPYTEKGMSVWHENGRVLLRTGWQQGMAGSLEWVEQVLSQAEREEQEIRVFSDAAEKLPASWRERAEVLPGPLSDKMAFPNPAASGLNFLQGSYLPASPVKAWIRPWRAVAAVLPLVFFIYLFDLKAETSWAQEQEPIMRAATQSLVDSYFPGTNLRGNVRGELSKRLEKVKQGVSFRDNSPWLAILQAETIFSNCQECRIESIKMGKGKATVVFSSSRSPEYVARSLSKLPGLAVQSAGLSKLGNRNRMRVEISISS